MQNPSQDSAPRIRAGRPAEREVRDQLDRILDSDAFSRSERLAAFLRFVVDETLAGRGSSLKESVIASALYGGAESSPVRTDARRVRDKLREYYAEAHSDAITIVLPKGSYSPHFLSTVEELAAPTATPARLEAVPRPNRKRSRVVPAIVGIAILTAAAAAILWVTRPEPDPPRIVPLTDFAGGESDADFSPDGNFVAFAWWQPPGPAAQDIWIKAIEGDGLRQLTATKPPVAEHSPAWSPDGKEIAFERVGWAGQPIENAGIYVVSALGGPERRIAESGRHPRWTRDGKSVLFVNEDGSAISSVELSTLRVRPVMNAPASQPILRFDVSPDGAAIACIASRRRGVSDLFRARVEGGGPVQVTSWGAPMEGVAWTLNGRELIFDAGAQSLWRVSAFGSTPARGKPVSGLEGFVTPVARALKPAMSAGGANGRARLAFQVQKADVSLRIFDLDETPRSGVLTAKQLADSTRVDMPGPFSPDGRRIAFRSVWSLMPAPLWVVARDGAGLHRVASVNAPFAEPASWSPDGRRIAFHAAVGGNVDVYTTAENGGELRRITADPASDTDPAWSRDGRHIYFTSNRSGRPEIWESAAEGGTATQATFTGGAEPAESADGLLYLDTAVHGSGAARTAALHLRPLNGAPDRIVAPSIRPGLWGVTERGIPFVTAEGESEFIDLCDLKTGAIRRIGRLPFLLPRQFLRMSFSRDGRWALTNQIDRRESDLMMVDSFR